MTVKEKEIRDAERKLMTKIRRTKLKMSKKLAAMSEREFEEYCRKGAEELKARGYNVVYSK